MKNSLPRPPVELPPEMSFPAAHGKSPCYFSKKSPFVRPAGKKQKEVLHDKTGLF